MEKLVKILRKEIFTPVLQKALSNITKNCVKNELRAGDPFPFDPDYTDIKKIDKPKNKPQLKPIQCKKNL